MYKEFPKVYQKLGMKYYNWASYQWGQQRETLSCPVVYGTWNVASPNWDVCKYKMQTRF